MVESARKMLGKAFADDEAALFSGFAFVQYVYATAGIAISDPGQFLDGATNALAAGEALTPGALIALERAHEGGVTISFAVATDAQALIYTIAGEEWVVSGDISQMEYDMAYAWNFQAE